MKLTKEQLEFIKEHLNDRPRIKYIRESGIGQTKFYGAIRMLGAEMRYDLNKKQEGIEECVKTYFPTMSAKEISERFGYSMTTVSKWAKFLGVRNTPEKDARMKKKILDALVVGRQNVDYVSLQKKRMATRKRDEWRVWEGKPQQTKFRFAKTTRKAYLAKWWLCNKYNYQLTDQPYVLAVTDSTRRMNEEYYEKKYKLKFMVKEETKRDLEDFETVKSFANKMLGDEAFIDGEIQNAINDHLEDAV